MTTCKHINLTKFDKITSNKLIVLQDLVKKTLSFVHCSISLVFIIRLSLVLDDKKIADFQLRKFYQVTKRQIYAEQ